MGSTTEQNPIVKQIDADTLRTWLTEQKPVTVVDIRTREDRAQWAIPGSLHADAQESLQSGLPGALADLNIPRDRPVVTVCNAGRVSQKAAQVLAGQGFDASSLTGGMKAWSLAWNAADVRLPIPSVDVVQVRRTGKGCLSYIVASDGEAAVIDPSVSPDVYLGIARERAWSIRYVIDTHVHADHLTRARELARLSGALLLMPPQQRVKFPFSPIADGGRLQFGHATLRAIHTPGHTQESTSFVLNEAAVFTGDTVFTNSVGRPDLHADPEAARARARALFSSLGRLRELGPETVILSGHASEPIAFDRAPIAARLSDVESWLSGWLVSESSFVERVTSHLPPTPPNFVRIVGLNEAGSFPEEDVTDLEAGANRCAVSESPRAPHVNVNVGRE